ncbi:ATP-binding protein [Streptomyces sp. NPDC008086]|uniref:ATP-binding protein n=1 Tax=Streptomyces sp. NPDC008086 TaxID=3364807 RepID=UPI0036E41A53
MGRRAELALERAFLDQAATGGGSLLLTGDAGVGKTALLDRAAAMALTAGSLVLRGCGVEFEADVPYSGLHQVLLPLEGELRSLEHGPRSALTVALGGDAGAAPDRARVSGAVLALFRRAAARRPLVVILDDVQWFDRASAGALGFVSRRLSNTRIGLLAGTRPGTESPFAGVGLTEHELRPLDDDTAMDLLRIRFPGLPPGSRARVVTQAQGNPLALLELAGDETSRTGSATASVSPPVGLPTDRIQTLFASQVNDLPARTFGLLLRAALDTTGDPRILQSTGAEALGRGDLGPAAEAGLIRVDDNSGRVEFAHPLIRSAVMRRSTSGERREAHNVLAHLLADLPERRAWHLASASGEPDEHVASLLDEVARRGLRRGEVGEAIAALSRAAELSPRGTDRSRRLAEAAYIEAETGGELRGTPRLLAAAHAADPGNVQPLHAAVAASYMLLTGEGDVDTAHRLLVKALDAAPVRDDADGGSVLNEALRTLLMVCFFGGRAELWDSFHSTLARSECDSLVTLCGATFCDPARATADVLRHLDDLIARSADERDPSRIVGLSIAGLFVDRLPGLRDALWRVVDDGRKGGAVGSSVKARMVLGIDDFLSGRWDHAQRLFDEGLKACDDHGYRILEVPGRWGQALLAAARGDFDAAAALTDDMTRWAAARGIRVAQVLACHVRTLTALGRGDYDEAYQQATGISPAGVLASRVPVALWVSMDLVESAVRSNRHVEAEAHVAAMREAGVASLSPRLALLMAGSAAMVAYPSTATARFEEALAVPGAGRWAFDLARVRLAYGEHLRRSRAITSARTQLDAALHDFRRMGARPWATRAENELLATGRTRSHAGEFGPAALTSREREIALLAASGLSNRQIGERLHLSARTVGAHLRHVFQKLGIASRVALRDALGPHPAPPDGTGARRQPAP